MGPTVRLRSRGSRALGAVLVVAALAGLVATLSQGSDALLRIGAPLALGGVMSWAAYWRPSVEVSDGGVTVVNTLRTVVVPWPALEEVDGRFGLTLRTSYGKVTAWGASAPTGRRRARTGSSLAGAAVLQRWQELRAAGYLDDRRLEQPRLAVTWHRRMILSVVVLALGAVVLPLAT